MINIALYPLAVLAVMVITQVAKNVIKPKWGDLGVQVFVALLSCLAAGLWFSKVWFSPAMLTNLISIWVAANGVYQILGKKIFEVLGEVSKGK